MGKHRITKMLKPATVSDRLDYLNFMEATEPDDDFLVKDIISFEVDHYGQPITVDPSAVGMYAVTDVDEKYSPKVTLYNIARGTKGVMKLRKPMFKKKPLKKGDVIYLDRWHPEQAYHYVNGVSTPKPGVTDFWIVEYTIE